jgi:hypothetical protein
VPILTPNGQREIGQDDLLLDQMTQKFIHDHLSYRFLVYPNVAQALAVGREAGSDTCRSAGRT